MNEFIIKEASRYVKEDSVLAMDLSDIHKEYAKKMDNLAGVWDGSKGEVRNGYWLNEIVCANVDEEAVVPMYSEMFSQKAKGFVSENTQIIKAINKVVNYTKGKGIWVWDRGGDRPALVDEFDKLGQRLRMNILLRKILTKAKRFFEILAFKHYAVADGIAHLLFNLGWESKIDEVEPENKRQLLLGFT